MRNLTSRSLVCLVSLFFTACGPAPAPTLSPEDAQNTALPLALTAVGLTMEAMASPTPIPPTATLTFTPAPTSPPLPTLAPPTTVTPTLSPCGGPVPPAPQGEKVSVRFVNKSGGSVNMAFGMTQPNSLGECGTYSFSFGPDDVEVVEVLAGCYWAYGWVQAAKPSTAQSIVDLCLTDPAQTRGISIGTEVIGFD
jgi:hypothetical protein